MFGKNIPIKPSYDPSKPLRVVEVFRTIQGEGPFAGTPAIFIRLAGCNLRCFFCDTDFDSHLYEANAEALALEAQKLAGNFIRLVVLTGGEPLAQNVVPLIEVLASFGFHTQIETAGTVWQEKLSVPLSGGQASLVCSPKTATVHSSVEVFAKHYKYIVRAGELDPDDGLPSRSTQEQGRETRLFRPPLGRKDVTVWVQPCDEFSPPEPRGGRLHLFHLTKENTQAAVETALRYGYRLSLQQHKILRLP